MSLKTCVWILLSLFALSGCATGGHYMGYVDTAPMRIPANTQFQKKKRASLLKPGLEDAYRGSSYSIRVDRRS